MQVAVGVLFILLVLAIGVCGITLVANIIISSMPFYLLWLLATLATIFSVVVVPIGFIFLYGYLLPFL